MSLPIINWLFVNVAVWLLIIIRHAIAQEKRIKHLERMVEILK